MPALLPKLALTLFLALLLGVTPGCATAYSKTHGGWGSFFSGTRTDFEAMSMDYEKLEHDSDKPPLGFPWCVFDLPFSLVGDVALLPFDIAAVFFPAGQPKDPGRDYPKRD